MPVENAFYAFGGFLLVVALDAQEIFLAKWWVWAAASALGDKKHIIPTRKDARRTDIHLERKYENPNDVINPHKSDCSRQRID